MSIELDRSRLDDAARAGWLYFVAGNTQDEIARKMNISRPTAQRLVSLAISERLITFRLDHPIAACMELARALTDRFNLLYCDIVPSDPDSNSPTLGVAEAAAAFLDNRLRAETPQIMAFGTGRTLRAAVDQLPRLKCPTHQLLSLVGNISPDGAASFFDVLSRLADLTQAPHYPMPLPVFASTPEERALFVGLSPVRKVRALAERADLTMVGVGQIDQNAQIYLDGFVTRDDLLDLLRQGAIGEIAGWCFDAEGRIVESSANERVTSIPHHIPADRLVVGVAMGLPKITAIRAALKGRILTGLITDEATAAAVLAG